MAETPRPSQEQIDFIEESIRAIGSVSTSPTDDAWWATWLASKNPFASRVPDQFEEIWKTDSLPKTSCLASAVELSRSFAASLKFSLKLWLKLPVLHQTFAARIQQSQADSRKAYILKTYAYPKNFEASGPDGASFNDPFFPGLRNYLEKNGFNVITVVHSIGALDEAVRMGPKMKASVFPYEIFVRRSDILKAYVRIAAALTRRFGDVTFRGKKVGSILGRQYRLDLCSSSGVVHFLYKDAFKRIAELFHPTHLIFTLENLPFERMCTSAMRERSPGTKIIGYQHSNINLSALNMYPAPGELVRSPHPDLVLTVGEEPALYMKRYGHYDDPKLEIRPACALRYQYLEAKQASVRESERILLAVLDGVPQARQQIDFIVKEAPSLKGWKIILREHPAMTLRDLQVNAGELQKVPGLEISKKSLQQDLESAGVVFYCESTVALEAIASGIPVVHWDNGRILNNDPLFYCADFKRAVQKPGDLAGVLDAILKLPRAQRESAQARAMEYLKKYFHPVNEQNLRKFI